MCTAETMARRGHPKFHLKNASRRSEARARWGKDSITWANEFFTETNDPVYDTSVDEDDEDDDEEEYIGGRSDRDGWPHFHSCPCVSFSAASHGVCVCIKNYCARPPEKDRTIHKKQN